VTYLQSAGTAFNYTAPFDGVITSWSIGENWSSAVKLKVLRPATSSAYSVVASDGPHNPVSGIRTYPVRFQVRQGDSIALQMGTAHYCIDTASSGGVVQMIAGDPPAGGGIASTGTPISNVRLPIGATLEPDRDHDGYGDETQDACPTVASTHGPCPLPTKLGETFQPSMTSGGGCDGKTMIPLDRAGSLAGVVYAAPHDGVITSWSFQGNDRVDGTVTLKTFRPVGGNSYRAMAQDGPRVPLSNAVATYPVRIPMDQDDHIGLSVSGTVDCGSGNGSGEQLTYLGNPSVGTTASFFDSPYSTNLSAVLEADADQDGFGDTTQDKCPTDPATQGTCPVKPPPPSESKACKAAKAKLGKAKAKLAKLKKNDAPAKKVKKAKKAVKKAKAGVKKAC
jgi:hypothetical protein